MGALGFLKLIVSLDKSDVDKGLAKTKKAVADAAKALKGVNLTPLTNLVGLNEFSGALGKLTTKGGLVVGAMAAVAYAFKKVADWAVDLKESASNAGTSIQTYQEIANGLQKLGNHAENAGPLLAKVNMAIAKALSEGGDGELAKSFSDLGISLGDLSKLDTGEVVLKISDGFKSAANSANALAAVGKIAGKSSREMVEFFRSGSAAIKESSDFIWEISGATASNLKTVKDGLYVFWTDVKGLTASALAQLIEGLRSVASTIRWFSDLLGSGFDLTFANEQFIKTNEQIYGMGSTLEDTGGKLGKWGDVAELSAERMAEMAKKVKELNLTIKEGKAEFLDSADKIKFWGGELKDALQEADDYRQKGSMEKELDAIERAQKADQDYRAAQLEGLKEVAKRSEDIWAKEITNAEGAVKEIEKKLKALEETKGPDSKHTKLNDAKLKDLNNQNTYIDSFTDVNKLSRTFAQTPGVQDNALWELGELQTFLKSKNTAKITKLTGENTEEAGKAALGGYYENKEKLTQEHDAAQKKSEDTKALADQGKKDFDLYLENAGKRMQTTIQDLEKTIGKSLTDLATEFDRFSNGLAEAGQKQNAPVTDKDKAKVNVKDDISSLFQGALGILSPGAVDPNAKGTLGIGKTLDQAAQGVSVTSDVKNTVNSSTEYQRISAEKLTAIYDVLSKKGIKVDTASVNVS
jgi:cell fate (sporulation/competence/biofilm development) regulator YlbF (YheA/YmcA/DUF963 family)